MKRPVLNAALFAALAFSAIAPASAFADQQLVRVTIQVQHYNDVSVAEYQVDVPCSSTSCVVDISTNSRDLGRVARWCGTTTIEMTVNAGDTGAETECAGSSTWKIRIIAGLRLDANNVASNGSDVGVQVNVTKS